MAWKCTGRLSNEGQATISTAICTRDDIMIYLIQNRAWKVTLAFTIMESVRKGKGLKPEWEEEMKAHECAGLVYLVVQKDQIYVPESTCGSLCYDGIPDCILQDFLSAGILCGIFQYPCVLHSAMS